jgi:hypothetical protein
MIVRRPVAPVAVALVTLGCISALAAACATVTTPVCDDSGSCLIAPPVDGSLAEAADTGGEEDAPSTSDANDTGVAETSTHDAEAGPVDAGKHDGAADASKKD